VGPDESSYRWYSLAIEGALHTVGGAPPRSTLVARPPALLAGGRAHPRSAVLARELQHCTNGGATSSWTGTSSLQPVAWGVGVHAGVDVVEGGELHGELGGLGAEDDVLGVDREEAMCGEAERGNAP